MLAIDERRVELRGIREERLFIKVTACESEPEWENKTIACSTLDVSASGMRLLIAEDVPANTQLDLWIEIKGNLGKFLLQGKVKWSTAQGDEYICGVELFENSEVCDMADWRDLFR